MSVALAGVALVGFALLGAALAGVILGATALVEANGGNWRSSSSLAGNVITSLTFCGSTCTFVSLFDLFGVYSSFNFCCCCCSCC